MPVAVVDGPSGVAPLAGLLLVGKLATCGVLDDPQAVSPIAAITMIAASPPHRPYGLGVLARLSAAVVFIALSLGWCADPVVGENRWFQPGFPRRTSRQPGAGKPP